jgi:hypothetical protein
MELTFALELLFLELFTRAFYDNLSRKIKADRQGLCKYTPRFFIKWTYLLQRLLLLTYVSTSDRVASKALSYFLHYMAPDPKPTIFSVRTLPLRTYEDCKYVILPWDGMKFDL